MNAYTGIGPTPANVVGVDNTIEMTFAPFSGGGGPGGNSMQMRENDIIDYVQPVANAGTFSSLDLRCNYWGTDTGPTNVPSGFETAFTPFSPVPIARRTVICTP